MLSCVPIVFSRHRRKVNILFAAVDILLVALAFAAAYQTRLWLPLERVFFLVPPVQALLLGTAVLLWPLAAYWLGVYERLHTARAPAVLLGSLRQAVSCAAGLVLLQYSLRLDISRTFLGLLAAYSWILVTLFRLKARLLVGWFWPEFAEPHYALVIGVGERARRLGESIERNTVNGARLIGFLADELSGAPTTLRFRNEYPVWPLAELPRILERRVIDEVLVAVDSRRLHALEEMLLACEEYGVRTRLAVDFFAHTHSDVYLDRLEGAPLLTFDAAPHDDLRLLVKRAIDLALSAAALLALSPLLLLVSLLIRLTSPGPAIFRQVRCGLNGRRFTFYKFRSMCRDAEQLKPGLEHMNRKQVAFKIPDDPRQTFLGRYLRRFSIDEWPQLWNVVKGDMSLVGPRPAVPEEVEQYLRWQRRRLRMRPGLTCLWALEGRDALDFDTWMRTDMEYIDHWSLAMDWKILLRTIPRVLTGKGAH